SGRTSSRERFSELCWGSLLCGYAISHAPAVLMLNVPGYEERNTFLLLYLLLVVQASDVLQYVWGKLPGRRRIAPVLSPSKTLEGALGGIFSATALGAVLAPVTPFSMIESAAIAFLLAMLGFCGGLLFSAIKRARGIKDWGTSIPG